EAAAVSDPQDLLALKGLRVLLAQLAHKDLLAQQALRGRLARRVPRVLLEPRVRRGRKVPKALLVAVVALRSTLAETKLWQDSPALPVV
ncbi:MAG TPA: hypothetical protein VIE65_19475, partial [Methylobacter sp.]